MPSPTLLLSSRHTDDSQLLWRAAIRRGWSVERTHGWRVPAHLRAAAEPVISIEALLAPSVAAELDLGQAGRWGVRFPTGGLGQRWNRQRSTARATPSRKRSGR